VAARGNTMDAALKRLTKLCADRLQHDFKTLFVLSSRSLAARAAALAFGELLVLRHRVVLENFALEDPDLHTAGAIGRERGGHAVVDVGTQGVQRHAALAVPLHACNFGATQAARAVDADAFGAEAHGGLNGALHGTAERNATLELLRNRFGDELRIELRLADFDDVDHDIAVGELCDHLAQLLDIGAFLADHHARTRRVDSDPALLVRALNHDVRYRRLLELLHQLLADLDVFVQKRPVLSLAREPPRIPGAVDTDAQPDRIDFLTHRLLLRLPPAPRPDARRSSGEKTALKSVPPGPRP